MDPHVGSPNTGYEGLFEALLRQSVDGIVLTELPSCRILAVSNSFCDLTGYSHDELIGGVMTDLGILRLDEVSAAIKRTAAGLRGLYEFRVERRDGRQRWIEVSAQLWRPTRLVMIVRDVTERWNAEAELRRQAERGAKRRS